MACGAQAVSAGANPEAVVIAVDEHESSVVVTLETFQSPIGWLNESVARYLWFGHVMPGQAGSVEDVVGQAVGKLEDVPNSSANL